MMVMNDLTRPYDDYVRAGMEARAQNARRCHPLATAREKQLNPYVDGVFDVWYLDNLPYSPLIHKTVDQMHTLANVISDLLNSVRPTQKGNDTGKYYKHDNRTYQTNVQLKCEEEGIFQNGVFDYKEPPWVLPKKTCLEVDECMKRVLGQYVSDDIPRDIMRAGKCQKSHDTIQWSHCFAPWCLRDKGLYLENILDITKAISLFNASAIHGPSVESVLWPALLKALVYRSGLVPPAECCITLHELVHICQQINECGLPRQSSLFKFEKVNKNLKGNLTNPGKGMS